MALCGAVGLYYLAHIGFRLRNIGSLNRERLALTAVVCALTPVARHIPALATLGIIAGLVWLVIANETLRNNEWRQEIRHAAHRAEHATD